MKFGLVKNGLFTNKWIKKILILFLLLISLLWEILFGFNNSLSAFYFCFFILAVVGCPLLYRNIVDGRVLLAILPFSAFFSISIYLANRDVLSASMSWENVFKYFLAFVGSAIVFFLASFAILHTNLITSRREVISKSSFLSFFLVPFFVMCLVDIFVLVFCCFPGNIDPDCINVLKQVYGETQLSNHHPFVYTVLLKRIIILANSYLSNVDYGIMIFLILQILFISLIFAYSILSLFRMGVNKGLLKAFVLISVFWPQNINYSITVGKDSVFASFALLLVVSFLRIDKGMGSMVFNYISFCFSVLGLCFFRSNGTFICIGVLAVAAFLFIRENKTFCFLFLIGILVSTFSKNMLMNMCDIQRPDTIEAFAIPTQQIARVISRSNNLSPEEKDLLSEIVDIDKVPDAYNSFWVDFVKDLVRKKGNQDYLREHKTEYLKLYLSLGRRNPIEYIKAWIDETSGYYSPQESFGVWYENVEKNDWGYERDNWNKSSRKIYNKYVSMVNNNIGLRVYFCIAFLVWLSNLLLIRAILKKNKLAILCGSYCVFLILSLLLTAPLNASYRYVYSLAYIFPFVLFVSL